MMLVDGIWWYQCAQAYCGMWHIEDEMRLDEVLDGYVCDHDCLQCE